MLGVMIGDVLGAPVEGWPRAKILAEFGKVTQFEKGTHMGVPELGPRCGMYTDDTQSTMGLMDSLVTRGYLDPVHCALNYAKFWEHEPKRGYPDSAEAVLKLMLQTGGGEYQHSGRLQFADGSFANGGAMKISPVALAFRTADDHALRRAVELAVVSSHVHPEAVEGAFIHAKAIQQLLNTSSATSFSRSTLIDTLIACCRNPPLRRQLETLQVYVWRLERKGGTCEIEKKTGGDDIDKYKKNQGLPTQMFCVKAKGEGKLQFVKHAASVGMAVSHFRQQLAARLDVPPATVLLKTTTIPPVIMPNYGLLSDFVDLTGEKREVVELVATVLKSRKARTKVKASPDELLDDEVLREIEGDKFQIKAVEAVPTALWGFLHYYDQPEKALSETVGFGGDTDTVASMVGALVGALHGTAWIPKRWYDNLENGEFGRDWCVAKAKQLSALQL